MSHDDMEWYGRVDVDGQWPPKLPDATTAAPGSDEKIQVLHERAMRGEDLFNPADEWRITKLSATRSSPMSRRIGH